VIWLNPIALAGVAAMVAPILIHILVQRRAAAFPFPTLRFLRPTRLASIRRHVLEDLPLLLVRAAILAAAAVALAGPLLVTPARRTAWNNRIARATVISQALSGGPERAAPQLPNTPPPDRRAALSGPPAAFQIAFATADLRDGIARAAAWLAASPPAKRELVVIAPFALGSLTRGDLSGVPPEVGIQLVRSGQLPATRAFAAQPILGADLATRAVHRRDRTIELDGPATSVREEVASPATVPIEIAAESEVKRAAEATLSAVLSQRVPAPVPGRTARVVFEAAAARSAKAIALRKPEGELAPWIADAIASLMVEGEAISSASAEGDTLVVTTALPPIDPRTARLFRSIFDALAAEDRSANPQPLDRSATALAERDPLALAEREVLTIPNADLRAWERPAGDVRSPYLDTVERDDRRWWWGAALALLALEAWLRRARRERADEIDEEAARVA
jgi:hypothetical protein